ncbi:MAG TPA: ATP-binding protein [Kofleriaceae bacterium]|nr:ATP-binding protein [Kofleriaceae bacterium]
MAGKRTDWLVGGGEMARLIKAKDWSTTPLGPIERWPQSLRTTVSLVQASSSPIALAWGPGHTQIYNDGYLPICGAKHPTSMGQDFRECWASAFPVIGNAYERAWAGQSGYLEKMRMFLDRYGFLEEAWFTFSFSPIGDESGGIGGLFHPVTELTGQMLSERRTRTLRDLAVNTANATTAELALQLAADVLQDGNLDVPFAIFYLLDDDASHARRVAQAGISAAAAGPELVELGEPGGLVARVTPWSIREAVRGGRSVLLDLGGQLGEQVGPYPELPTRALVLPIAQTGSHTPSAVVVAGVSARLTLTDAYHVFFDLLGGAVATSLTNARTLEQARHETEALAELDRAKTTFFSNVSHEFRTPLTLILGPLEDELGEDPPLPPARRKRLATVHRNAIRLLKLVNTLLDFSRIEAGRLHATYEPVDLATETAQLAGVFRAAIENAGLTLTIDCPPLPSVVHIDREMWEKIVLNLLSNAFKHTATGGITVELRWHADHVALRVIDTGIGISPSEVPRLFERFHRVKSAWSRSHEGTGIGLALVRELARTLGGDVEVASTEGVGSVLTVTVKTGTAHLPADHVRPHGESGPLPTIPIPVAATASAAFADEAAQWRHATITGGMAPLAKPAATGRPRVVWVDDNADMRAYVTKLLEAEFDVIAVGDGVEALRVIRDHTPDLVLSDVMMPNLDGFELLTALRGDARTRTVPVILLSARAGEASSVEALDAGADDYLIKPFSARELVSRVRTHIALNETRRRWARQLEKANQELEAFGYSVSHDLRAPLRAVDAFTQILLADHVAGLDAKGVEYLKRILASAQRMSAIIDDLLALSQIGRGELRLTTIDLAPIVCSIVAELRARTPGRRVEVQVADEMIAVCDPRLVTIALENLLANAWKFTGKQAHPMIIVGREAPDVFFVRDNGVGFDMHHAEQLFEPFRRLHAATEFEGTGIGLAIVRRVVERHGGRVWAHGGVNEGATVRFTLQAGASTRD